MRLRWPQSLFGQLLLAQAMLVGVAAPIMPIAIGAVLQRTADDFVAGRLRHDATLIAWRLQHRHDRGAPAILRDLGPPYAIRATRGFRILGEDGRLAVGGGANDRFPPAALDRAPSFTRHGDLDVYQQATVVGGRPFLIQVAQDRSQPEVIVDDIVTTFLRRAWWMLPAMLSLSLLGCAIVARRSTARLRGASRDADRIGPDNLDGRIAVAPLPLEVRGLASATNAALDRVEDAYRRQTAFVASVAHELRTPLALVMLRCDALLPSPERDALHRAIDQSTHVVSQLMELAAIDGRPPELGPIDIAGVVDQVVRERAPIVFRSGRSIEAAVADQNRATGNAGLLHIAVANLIDNAVRHTPAGTHIVVAARRGLIEVADDGPGVVASSDEAGRVRVRAAGRQRTDGAGLGLAIVARIMTTMGGRMEFATPTAGTLVRLFLEPG
ncbi:ATP-binding protein [Sphingomonas sp. SUN019]|uniref:sensor histidine kinase n=1 Tax=Sphingomonas sp. SUN019 TaxID=2937788 RepID=UPI002164AD67|nr:ATP-binding protein [Sphingomonas sp. SUN019]UVO50705.1 ATP-binding protein [Sphingomonas sp. SUN019]